MIDFLPGEIRTVVEADLAASYGLFDRVRTYIPTKTACTACGGVDVRGEPIDNTCATCTHGYTWAWTVQELDARIADIALATHLFVSVTPGVQVGDKMLFVDEEDAAVLQAVFNDEDAYVWASSATWRPNSVQPSQLGRHPEWVAHLRKHTPEVTG